MAYLILPLGKPGFWEMMGFTRNFAINLLRTAGMGEEVLLETKVSFVSFHFFSFFSPPPSPFSFSIFRFFVCLRYTLFLIPFVQIVAPSVGHLLTLSSQDHTHWSEHVLAAGLDEEGEGRCCHQHRGAK